jgi:hypothetical protein
VPDISTCPAAGCMVCGCSEWGTHCDTGSLNCVPDCNGTGTCGACGVDICGNECPNTCGWGTHCEGSTCVQDDECPWWNPWC